jgi:hypothetical protein
VVPNSVTLIPNFVKIGQMFQMLKTRAKCISVDTTVISQAALLQEIKKRYKIKVMKVRSKKQRKAE